MRRDGMSSLRIKVAIKEASEDHSSSFTTARVNATTFAITENDKYGEHPIIYAKIHPKAPVIILSDTGCNAPSKLHTNDRYIHLLDHLEKCPIPENDDAPLNPASEKRKYVIMCSHCHYDHISGIEQFASLCNSAVIGSEHGRAFIETDLPTHSLCEFVGIATPKYRPTHWAPSGSRLLYNEHDGNLIVDRRDSHALVLGNSEGYYAAGDVQRAQRRQGGGHDTNLGITVFNTPGHTPDSLSWYDHDERHLYVGDSFYEQGAKDGSNVYTGPIIFPKEGDWTDWTRSMEALLALVKRQNMLGPTKVRLGCAHATVNVDAEVMLEEVLALLDAIIRDRVPVVAREWFRGELNLTWMEKGSKYAVKAPVRLAEEVREV